MDNDSGQRERLRQKFAVLQSPPSPVAVPAAPPLPKPRSGLRRKDYKGERKRLNLRLPATIVDDLNVFCLAARVDKNGFCEELLRQALDKQLPELQKQFTAEEWDVFRRCAAEGK